MPALRIIFMGTAELACPSLTTLSSQAEFNVLAVVTQPDKPKGRDLKLQPSPVKTIALERNLPVLQPARARNEAFVLQLRDFQPELIVVAAYGQILPQSILDLPRFGCLNVHASILPKYRGAAPIQWAILSDESETGVTIMKMDAGLDTGGIVSLVTTPILPDDNAQTLHDRLARLGAELLVETIPDYVTGRVRPNPQPAEGASHARKIAKEDGRIDWSLPARAIWNRIRAFTPWPGAFTLQNTSAGQRLIKIWSATVEEQGGATPGTILCASRSGIVVACGQQSLCVLQLQREGGRRLGAAEFLAGSPLAAGERFISDSTPKP
jgi:methionyl-tRNA formyltransferase